MFVVAIFLAIQVGAIAFSLLVWSLVYCIDAREFARHIKRLVMASAVDKAIKLCNAAPKPPASLAIKTMLMRHRRPWSLELRFQDGMVHIRRLSEMASRRFLYGQLGLAALAAMVVATPDHGAEVPLYVAVGLWLLSVSLWWRLVANLAEQENRIILIRDFLWETAGYVPPQYRPRKFTETELTVWKARMAEFEKEMETRRAAGEEFDAADEYDARADANGVLPSL